MSTLHRLFEDYIRHLSYSGDFTKELKISFEWEIVREWMTLCGMKMM